MTRTAWRADQRIPCLRSSRSSWALSRTRRTFSTIQCEVSDASAARTRAGVTIPSSSKAVLRSARPRGLGFRAAPAVGCPRRPAIAPWRSLSGGVQSARSEASRRNFKSLATLFPKGHRTIWSGASAAARNPSSERGRIVLRWRRVAADAAAARAWRRVGATSPTSCFSLSLFAIDRFLPPRRIARIRVNRHY